MAYMDYGGKSVCDGVAIDAATDTTLKSYVNGIRIDDPLLELLANTDRIYHAIIGDRESGIMVLMYKQGIAGVIDAETLEPIAVEAIDEHEDDDWFQFEVNGVTVETWWEDDPYGHQVVEFLDPKKRKWEGFSGYHVGAGFEDED